MFNIQRELKRRVNCIPRGQSQKSLPIGWNTFNINLPIFIRRLCNWLNVGMRHEICWDIVNHTNFVDLKASINYQKSLKAYMEFIRDSEIPLFGNLIKKQSIYRIGSIVLEDWRVEAQCVSTLDIGSYGKTRSEQTKNG